MYLSEMDTINRIHDYYVIASLENDFFQRDIMWTQLVKLVSSDEQMFIFETLTGRH